MIRRKKSSFVLGILYGFFGLAILPFLIARVNKWYMLPSINSFPLQILGIILLAVGGCILSIALIEFFIYDETILPSEEPKNLVTTGIFKYSRNPIFVSLFFIWSGEAFVSGAMLLFVFAICASALNHYHVVAEDEKKLRKKFGEKYVSYCKKTPRYIPQVHL